MITGNATTLLSQGKDAALHITTPAIAAGTNLSVHLVPKPALVLGLITVHGPIEISIAVEEKDALTEITGLEEAIGEG
jgi:CheY-specific phosphatase CheX